MPDDPVGPPKKKLGFAAMSPEKHRQIASRGGASVSPENRSFSKDPALASTAGRKGGASVHPEDRAFKRDRKLASNAGRKGGERKKHSD